MITQKNNGCIVDVRVHPGAKKNEVTQEDGVLKVSVSAAPEKGKANKAVIELLSKTLKIKRSQIEIISGETSSNKRIFLDGVTLHDG